MADIIESVETFIVDGGPKNLIYLKLRTRDGVVGWGECYNAAHRERAITALVEELAFYLKGRDLFSIKHFAQVAYADVAIKRGSMEFYSAMSGVEIAMWDAIGKTVGQPIYNLLGGPCRSRFRVYANGWFRKYGGTDAELEAKIALAKKQVARGFTALKFDPFPGPWRPFIERTNEDIAVRTVAAMREAVGPDVDLLIEAHRRLAPMIASRVEERLSEYRPFWFEEPISSSNLDVLADVRRTSSTPVVAGEEIYTKQAFSHLLRLKAADILNPDVGCCGGILQLTEIGSMADTELIAMAPHCYNSTNIGLAATVHASAVMPNFLITEYFVSLEPVDDDIATKKIRLENGSLVLPDAPGLGIEIDEAALARHLATGVKPAHERLRRPDEENA